MKNVFFASVVVGGVLYFATRTKKKEIPNVFYFFDDKVHVFGESGLAELTLLDFATTLRNIKTLEKVADFNIVLSKNSEKFLDNMNNLVDSSRVLYGKVSQINMEQVPK